jgi:VRR-NUC domain
MRAYHRSRSADRPLAEGEIQKAVFQHLATRGVGFSFHVPNGGWRSPIEAAILKGQGTRPGVPDIVIVYGGKCFALELKAAGGTLSPAQREAIERMRAAGADVGVAYGLTAALQWLEERGILRGRAS